MAASASSLLPSFLVRTDVRWAVGGWAFFIAENAILSENRTTLIECFGNETYHALYGICSTIATGSIAYSYYYLTKKLPTTSVLRTTSLQPPPPAVRLVAAWSTLSVGLCLASQAVPQLQIPVNSQLQVRCPFDFAADRRRNDGAANNEDASPAPRGLERITRHPVRVSVRGLLLAACLPAC